MDIKKETVDVDIFDAFGHDTKTAGDAFATGIEDGIEHLVKSEKMEDLEFIGVDTGLFGNADISFSLKTEEDSNDSENLVNISDEFYDNNGAFLIGECSDEESETSFHIGYKNTNDVEDSKLVKIFDVRGDTSGSKGRYVHNWDNYDEDKHTGSSKVIIKKEMLDGFKAEMDEDVEEEVKYRQSRSGCKTKKSKDFICKICDRGFTSEARLKQHKTQLHPGGEDDVVREGRHQCQVCQKRFTSQSKLTMHSVTHTGDKPYSCEVCGQSFSHPTNKRRHMLKHTGDKPFLCLFCRKSFPAKHSLKDHLVKHTGEKPHECKLCFMTFAHRFTLKQHQLLKHPGGEVKVKDSYEDRPFTCQDCKKKFTQQSALKVHQRLHTGSKPYMCDLCDASFTRSDALSRHKTEHTGKKSYPCNLCGEPFTSAYYLKQHRKIHVNDLKCQRTVVE